MPATSATSSAARPIRGAGLTGTADRARLRRRAYVQARASGLFFAKCLSAVLALAIVPSAAHAEEPSATTSPAKTVAGQIRSLAGGKLKAVYRARGYWPLWIRDGAFGAEADRLIDFISTADLDGLDPKTYEPDKLREIIGEARGGSPEAMARAELKLSETFADYVRDVRRAPAVAITYLDPELAPQHLKAESVLRVAALAPSFADYINNGAWMSPIYVRLRSALAKYHATWDGLPAIAIPSGPMLRAGAKGERVRMLRRRLGQPDGAIFDKALATRVRAFQADHGLPADARVGGQTIAALNRGPAYYERIIRLNLERARVLPGAGVRHIVVDAASARMWFYNDGKEQGSMRVIVGKPTEQTPMLAGMVRYVILNPYWNVPSDLIQRRIAPKMLGGGSLAAMKFEALSGWGADPQQLDPAAIDWNAVAAGRQEVRIRQLPGSDNAMGRMKFMFPNDLGIYLHDTPDKTLFTKTSRLLSSGCVRLEDAPQLAEWLFGKPLDPPSAAPEQQIPLPQAVPVYLTYLTVEPTDTDIAFHEDVYGRDARAGRLATR